MKYSEAFEQLVYISERTSDHFFRRHQGFGFSVAVLRELRRIKVRIIIILYKHDGMVDKLITFREMVENPENHYKYVDKNCDTQFILPINKFNQHFLEGIMNE